MSRLEQFYEHKRFGSIVVLWRDEVGYDGAVPYAFEADLFTPDSEIESLTEWMRSVRLDRSLSVSAFDTSDSGDLPWAEKQ